MSVLGYVLPTGALDAAREAFQRGLRKSVRESSIAKRDVADLLVRVMREIGATERQIDALAEGLREIADDIEERNG